MILFKRSFVSLGKILGVSEICLMLLQTAIVILFFIFSGIEYYIDKQWFMVFIQPILIIIIFAFNFNIMKKIYKEKIKK